MQLEVIIKVLHEENCKTASHAREIRDCVTTGMTTSMTTGSGMIVKCSSYLSSLEISTPMPGGAVILVLIMDAKFFRINFKEAHPTDM